MNVLVKDVMSEKIEVLSTKSTLREAIEAFTRLKLDVVPVVREDGSLVAVLTKYKVFHALLNNFSLGSSIVPHLITDIIFVGEDEKFKALEEILIRFQVAHAIVVNKKRHPVGIVAKVDLIRFLIGKTDLLTSELASLIHSISNGVISVSTNGLIMMVNPAAEKILGISGMKIIGEFIQKVFPEIDLREVLGKGKNLPWSKRRINNTLLLTSFSPVLDSDSKIKGALIVLQDLAEYEQIAQELESVKKLQQTLEIVLDLAYDGIIVVDEKGSVTMLNNALADFLKVSDKEIINQPVKEVFPEAGLDKVLRAGFSDVADVQTVRSQRCIITRQPIIHEGRIIGAVGKVMYKELERLRHILVRLDMLEKQVSYYKGELDRLTARNLCVDDIIGSSPVLEGVKKEAKKAAVTTSTVLLLGESGVGKDLFARAIHNESGRKGPFIKINCAAIPENLLESELFGYEEGAFTGAKKGGKPGKFELANSGTLFLDEIGDMPCYMQAKLLRVLQEKEFERVGGTKTMHIDIRIIAATNNDLYELIEKGKFRKDLFYRLSVIQITIPPLRDRRKDIVPIASYLIEKFNRLIGVHVTGISEETLKIFFQHSWPGNVRELENIIERALNLTSEGVIETEHLPVYLFKEIEQTAGEEYGTKVKYREKLSQTEKQVILTALANAEGNRSKAARLLGISRTSFYEKLKRFNIS